MGCASSAVKEDGDGMNGDTEDTKTAKKQQRRRLSVAPQLVGSAAPNGEKHEEVGLTEVEVKARDGVKHAAMSRKGLVPYNKNKVNQDRAILKYALQDDPGMSLFGVMDGHGEFGHHVAGFVSEKLPVYLAQEKELRKDPPKYIKLAVKKMCDELATTQINISFSGTTAVFGVKIDQKLYVANIGDSRCVLGHLSDDGSAVVALPLSTDQKPELPKEKARIIKAGGRVEPLPGPPGEDCGPPRVWLAEVDVPGLAMSRSIGDDVSATVGVISEPEVVLHDIEPKDLFVVWASDGVWEFVSNEMATSIVYKYRHDLKEAANQLVEESHRRWKLEEEVVDDITCVIVSFESKASPPPS